GIPTHNLGGWQEKYLQPVVIALIILAMFTGPIILLETIFSQNKWQSLPWLILLVSAEGILTTRWLTVTERKVGNLTYRAAEITVIFLFLRLFTWLFVVDLPSSNDLTGFLFEPSTFIDPMYFVFCLLLFFAWQQTITMTKTFSNLQLDFEELRYYSKTGHERYQLERPLPKDRKSILGGFFRQWVAGGVIVGIFATLTTFDLSTLDNNGVAIKTIGRLGLPPAMLGALLTYFIGGLWLAGQGQLAVLRSRWLLQDTRLDQKMNRTWNRASAALIGIIAAIAAFLPIGSTFAISRILQFITLVVIAIINLVFLLLSVILALFISIFMKPGTNQQPDPLDLTGIVPEQLVFDPLPEKTPTPLWGTIFWLIVIVAVIAAVIFFLRGRGVPITGGRFFAFLSVTWTRLRTWFRSLWHGFERQVQHFEQSIRERLQITEKPIGRPLLSGRPSFRSLSPREKIRYYYLSIVRRAEEKGVERGKSVTPSEYAAELKEEWPEATMEVENITDAFLKARYSPQQMTGNDLGSVKETWNRIKSTIRKRKS
ncbi:MAG: DUF4129 domain-containing protein, partial [Candidatus Promineifilaceae bacterium]